MVDVAVSEASRQKAAAAKSYIENMYRVHAQKHQDRRDRCSHDALLLRRGDTDAILVSHQSGWSSNSACSLALCISTAAASD